MSLQAPAEGKVVLHSYWRSSCSYRVRFALALKGIKYEYRAVNLLKSEQKEDSYTSLNPTELLPTLEIDGVKLVQSGAILEYLEETRPESPLLPKDPKDRAIVRALRDIIGCDTQPVQNLKVLKRAMAFFDSEEEKNKQKLAWGKTTIEEGFKGLEALMSKVSGKYSFGDSITLPDLYLAPQIYNAKRFGVDLSAYPTISRVYDALEQHPAFKAAYPDAQPDAVPGAK